MNNTKKGFTLVELIIVISMIAILGTISTISFLNDAKNSRDSSRVNDAEFIAKAVELYYKEYNKYPVPENPKTVTYSGAELWYQGTFGDPTVEISGELEKAPYDPLYLVSYPYSIVNTRDHYQISYVIEGAGISHFKNHLIGSTHAAEQRTFKSKVIGNYNKKVLITKTGSTSYVIATPSIMSSDLSNTNFMNIITSKHLVYNNYFNVAYSYDDNNIVMNGGFDFVPGGNLLVYVSTGTFHELRSSELQRLTLSLNIQNAYSGSIISSDIGRIISTEIDLVTPSDEAKEISTYVVEKYLHKKVNK